MNNTEKLFFDWEGLSAIFFNSLENNPSQVCAPDNYAWKVECNESSCRVAENPLGYDVSVDGNARESNWTSNPGVDYIKAKGGQNMVQLPGGTSGTVLAENLDGKDISNYVACVIVNPTSTPIYTPTNTATFTNTPVTSTPTNTATLEKTVTGTPEPTATLEKTITSTATYQVQPTEKPLDGSYVPANGEGVLGFALGASVIIGFGYKVVSSAIKRKL